MSLRPKTINVLPNPWCALDGEGRAAGVCDVDPDLLGVSRIGAKVAAVNVEQMSAQQRRTAERRLQAPRQSITWEFDTENPVETRFTGDAAAVIMRKVRNLELLPADAQAAKLCGVKFREPARALAEEKAKARAEFDASHGAGTFDEQAAERGETQTKSEPAAAAPKNTTRGATRSASKGDNE